MSVVAPLEQPMKGVPRGDLLKMANARKQNEINIWTNKNDTPNQRSRTEFRKADSDQTDTRRNDSQPRETQKKESRQVESKQIESRQKESKQNDSRQPELRQKESKQIESQKKDSKQIESQKPESRQTESKQIESLKRELRQHEYQHGNPKTEPRQTESQPATADNRHSESPLDSLKNMRKSYSASTISTASIKTSSDSSSSISSTSKQSTQTDNSGKSFHINPILVKDARSRNFIVGSITHQASLLGTEELNRYFPNSTLNIAIITWNMCSKPAKSGTLADLLMPDKMHYLPDLYVIGVQEAPYSNNNEQRDWEIQLQSTIGTEHVVLHSASMGVLHLIVFIRRHLIWYTSRPENSSVNSKNKTHNMIKTKGAVGISFRIFGTSLLFINSHFPAHEKRNKQRIEEYQKICTQLNLPKNLKSLPIKYVSNDVTNRFDYCFWLGDLNFRIEKEQDDMIKELNSTTDFGKLLQHDQLLKAIKEDEIFSKFQEADRIKFGPTYKFNIGTNDYDIAKNRVPSWTDRILYKVKSHRNEVNCLEYNSVLELDTSDHKPVYSLVDIKLKPGKDDCPLNAGRFQRDIYLEGIKKRQELWTEMKVRDRLKKTQTKNSLTCNLS